MTHPKLKMTLDTLTRFFLPKAKKQKKSSFIRRPQWQCRNFASSINPQLDSRLSPTYHFIIQNSTFIINLPFALTPHNLRTTSA